MSFPIERRITGSEMPARYVVLEGLARLVGTYQTADQAKPGRKEELSAAVFNSVWDLQGPKTAYAAFTDGEKDVIHLFQCAGEVEESLEFLKDFEHYLRRFPFSKTRITKSRYLSHVVGTYLQEVYILENRLISMSEAIELTCAGTNLEQTASELAKKIRRYVKKALGTLRKARGMHVHHWRDSNDDIQGLIVLDLLANPLLKGDPDAKYCKERDRRFRKLRTKWVEITSQTARDAESVVDQCFSWLIPLLFRSST